MRTKEKTYTYSGLVDRVKVEWPVYLLAFLFIAVADSIGQFRIPVWKGQFVIFPIFYSLALGLLSGPNITKILDDRRVKAAGGLVGIAILPFIAKLGVNAGSSFMAIIQAGPALLLQEFGNLGTIFFSIMASHLFPSQNIVHSLIESADGHDVEHMIIDGKLLMENRRLLTIDEEEVRAKAANLFEKKALADSLALTLD